MQLLEALETFKPDNLSEIIEEYSANLQNDLHAYQEEAKQLGTSWVADEVRKMCIAHRFRDRAQHLKRMVQYHQQMGRPKKTGDITSIDIARAKEYPIQDMYTGKLQQVGGKFQFKGLCPFHNDKRNPAFYIDKKNQYHCFTCAAHGDAIAFHQKTTGSTFVQSVRYLAHL